MTRTYKVGEDIRIIEGANEGCLGTVKSTFTTSFGRQFLEVILMVDGKLTAASVRASDVELR